MKQEGVNNVLIYFYTNYILRPNFYEPKNRIEKDVRQSYPDAHIIMGAALTPTEPHI